MYGTSLLASSMQSPPPSSQLKSSDRLYRPQNHPETLLPNLPPPAKTLASREHARCACQRCTSITIARGANICIGTACKHVYAVRGPYDAPRGNNLRAVRIRGAVKPDGNVVCADALGGRWAGGADTRIAGAQRTTAAACVSDRAVDAIFGGV